MERLRKTILTDPDWRTAAGFDGYVDRLARVVARRDARGTPDFYPGLADFGSAVQAMAGLSGDRELIPVATQAGGNAPLFCKALGALGARGTLVGGLGIPVASCFSGIAKGFALMSLGGFGDTLALEFDDGKLMLADASPLKAISLKSLELQGLLENVLERFARADLVLLANWNQMPGATDLWARAARRAAEARLIFVDLADITQQAPVSLEALFRALDVPFTLGVNEKEARALCEKLGAGLPATGENAAELLNRRLRRPVAVHGVDYAVLAREGRAVSRKGRRVARPVMTTGGGDHFNAGYCFAAMQGAQDGEALDFGMAVSGFFVSHGRSPDRAEALGYLATNA